MSLKDVNKNFFFRRKITNFRKLQMKHVFLETIRSGNFCFVRVWIIYCKTFIEFMNKLINKIFKLLVMRDSYLPNSSNDLDS